MMFKVSVIIPVYNAENSLSNAIESVINQTIEFKNIELILVDDNSSDGSKQIISNYANYYNNIKPIFLEKNTGSPSEPRNIGISNASAPYLMFLDNDDEFRLDYCEILYNTIVNSDVDIVNCDFTRKLNDNMYILNSIDRIDFEKHICDEHEKMFLKLACWGNIYSTSFIKDNNIKFPKTLYEDGVFYLHCLLKTTKPVIRLPKYPGYIYLIENNDSITHDVSLNTLIRFLEGYTICGKLLKENSREDVEQKLFSSFVNMAIFILIKLDNISEGIKLLYEFENSLKFDIILNSKFLNIVNDKIKNKQFIKAKFFIKLLSIIYSNNYFKNKIFIKYSNLKKVNLNEWCNNEVSNLRK